VFPDIIAQARGDAGGLLVLAGLVDILELLNGLALALGMNQSVNAVHFQIQVVLMNHEFISPKAECRKKQPARQRVRKRIERESNQPAKQRVNEPRHAPVSVHEIGKPAECKRGSADVIAVLPDGAVELKPAFDALDDCQNEKANAEIKQGNRLGAFIAGLRQHAKEN